MQNDAVYIMVYAYYRRRQNGSSRATNNREREKLSWCDVYGACWKYVKEQLENEKYEIVDPYFA